MDKTFYAIGIILVIIGLILLYTSGIRVEYSSQVIDVPVYTLTTIPPGTYTATKTGDLHQLLVGETIELEENQALTKTINITQLEAKTLGYINNNCDIIPSLNIRIEGEGSKGIHITIKQGRPGEWSTLLDEDLSPKENVFSKEYLLRLLDPEKTPLIEVQVKAIAKTKLNLLEILVPYLHSKQASNKCNLNYKPILCITGIKYTIRWIIHSINRGDNRANTNDRGC